MIAKVIALSLIPAGAAALGVVGYMQHHSRAFTSDIDVPVHIAPPPHPLVAVPTPAPTPEPEPVMVSPLVVTKPVLEQHAHRTAAPAPMPCSGWRDLGYAHVNDGKPSDVRRVRELCDPTASPSK